MLYNYDGVLYHYKCGFLSAKGFGSRTDARTHLVFPDTIPITENGKTKKVFVEEIDTGAFLESTNLREVVLPSHLKWIGHSAFAGCQKLEKVITRKNKGTIHILGSAFMCCSQLKEVKLNTTVELSQKTFEDCYALSRFDADIWLISSNTFKNCQKLQRLSLISERKNPPARCVPRCAAVRSTAQQRSWDAT